MSGDPNPSCIVCSKGPAKTQFVAIAGLDALCVDCFHKDLQSKGKDKVVRALEEDGFQVKIEIYNTWLKSRMQTTPITQQEYKKAIVQPKPADLADLRKRIARTVFTKIQELEVIGHDKPEHTLDSNELGALQSLIETLRFLQGAQETVEALMQNIKKTQAAAE